MCSRSTWYFVLAASLGALGALSRAARAQDGAGLFAHRWVAHDKRSPEGDGLGPMHNATSCAACHHQGGAGGGGDKRHNVELLSVKPVDGVDESHSEVALKLANLHPGFKFGEPFQVRSNVVLHRFGPEADYYDFRARLLGIEEPRPDVDPARRAVLNASLAKRLRQQASPVRTLAPVGDVSLLLSERNTPALWGAGLVDAVSDVVIEEMAESQQRGSPATAGRAPHVAGGDGVGRFGWRGQTGSLREFVLIACANELGLQTKDHRQPKNPLASHYENPGSDLSDADAEALIKFVANLPRPIELKPKREFAAAAIAGGERTFERIGCADCHPREMGRIDGLFSDLLLHDMGPDFADPVEPNPDVGRVETRFASYSGFGQIVVVRDSSPSLPREWRTPALWGVRDSAPYMHDGRAKTLAEAIAMHGGQAATSSVKFRELSGGDRASLIAFLESLVSPSGGLGQVPSRAKW